MLTVVHGVEELVFVDEAANEEVDEAEEEDEEGAGEDAVDGTDDEDQDRLGEEKAIRKHWRLYEFSIVSRGLSANKVNGVERDTAKLQEAEGQEAETLKDYEVSIKLGKFLDGGCEDVEGAGGVAEGVANAVEEAGGFGGGAEDGEEEEEVEEGEEEIFGDEGKFDFALGDHALEV